MAKSPTTPLKITAHLIDGRINSSDGIIMFDSILYHAWFLKHAPEVIEGTSKETFDGYFGLPLRQLPENRWAASKGIYIQSGREIDNINKRPNFFNADKENHLEMKKGLISDSVGKYRAYRIPQIVRTVKDGIVTFFCVGHGDEIMDLLNLMNSIGKKPAVGFGAVDRWEIEDAKEDLSLWHPEYGLMRPTPVDSEESVKLARKDYPVMQYGIKPPYWKQKNMRLCYVPMETT